MTYYERLRDLRKNNHYIQQDIANKLHVGQRTYSNYESGKIRMPIESLIILAKFYNVNMDYISGISDIKIKYPAL